MKKPDNVELRKADKYTTDYYVDGKLKYRHYKDGSYEWWQEYDDNGNPIYRKDSDDFESWTEYDDDGNEIHFRNSDGYKSWTEYDADGNMIHFKDSDGKKWWSDDHPDNPKYKEPEYKKPFTF